jgi:hypothetical protein
MFRKTLLIFSLLVTGCSSWTTPAPKDESAPPLEKVFSETYENVWRSTQLALASYPIKVNDSDSGIFETQLIRGDKTWVSPSVEKNPSGGQRYKISVRILKGNDKNGDPATKVIVLKRAEIQRDFFAETEKLPSDGLEELSIMYRIERELDISKTLAKLKR